MHRHAESKTLARGSELAVYQCGHGLLHVRVNRVTLTLKPDEFRQFAMLVGEAHGTRNAVRVVHGSPAATCARSMRGSNGVRPATVA